MGSWNSCSELDSQVKIRGYRIELGEIEAALSTHPLVSRCAVIAHANSSGDTSIAAYVAAPSLQGDIRYWREIWESTYGNAGLVTDSALNTAGWISSYTREPISETEMQEWVNCAVGRIDTLEARQILEIGCGFGMLLLRLAPSCERYCGLDFSPVAVRYVANEIERRKIRNTTVRSAAAHELNDFKPGTFDLVILNSVVQYFPDVEYLVGVLERVVPLVASGGSIFIGDVRSLPLLDAFHASVELEQSPADLPITELRRRIKWRLDRENELVLAPAFFSDLRQHLPAITQVEVLLKRGRRHNEMTLFRYDVILRIGACTQGTVAPIREPGASLTLEQLRERLKIGHTELVFSGIPNARVLPAIHATELIAEANDPATAGKVRERLEVRGIDPEDIFNVDGSYDVHLTWTDGAPGFFDAMFCRRNFSPDDDNYPSPGGSASSAVGRLRK